MGKKLTANHSKQIYGLIGLLGLMCFMLFFRYGAILTTPHAVVNNSGDSFNACYIITYQGKYGDDFTHFKGNAYPYGEHIVLASALPLLSNSLGLLRKMGLDLTDYTIPIIYSSILFSYLVGALFLYLILLKFELSIWYSVLVATGIMLLSPQTDRIFSHVGLAHAYTIPMTIYFLLLFEEKRRWWVSICLFLTVMFTAAIQFYFFAISALLLGLFYFLVILKKLYAAENKKNRGRTLWLNLQQYLPHFSLQVLLPFILFSWWIARFSIIDRPTKPYGYTHFISQWEGIFLSLRMPYYQWINKHLIPFNAVEFEGMAYVGLVAFIVFISMLLYWIRYRFKQSFFIKIISNSHKASFLQSLFATALILLIFSSGFPFTIPRLTFLLDYTGPLKQLRSVGRFNWVFYYIMNLVTFIYLYHKYWRHNAKKLLFVARSKWIVIIGMIVMSYEISQLHQTHPYQMYPLVELKEKDYYQKYFDFHPNNYQAVLPIPFFHVGTDNFNPTVSPYIQQKSSLLSMETSLPTIAALSNRSSISRTYKLFQTASEPYQIPAILSDFPLDKPILVIADTNYASQYDYLLPFLRLIGQKQRLQLYEMPLNFYEKRIINIKEKNQQKRNNQSFFAHQGLLSSDSLLNFCYKNFDENPTAHKYKGEGALAINVSEESVIFREQVPNAVVGESYVLSFWCDLNRYPAANTLVYIKAFDSKTGQQLWKHFPQIRNFLPVMDNNGWALFEFSFQLPQYGIIEVSLLQKEMTQHPFYLDELLLKKEATLIYHIGDKLFYNNRWYEEE